MQVLLTSPWVPPEWVRAHGLEPRGVWFDPRFRFDGLPLAAGVCAFAQATLRLAESAADSAVIFSTHCDQLRRAFDLNPASRRLFLFNQPATWQSPVAEKLYRAELDRLSRFLQALGGRPPRAAELGRIVADYASARRQLLDASAACSARGYAEAIAQFHWDGAVRLSQSSQSATAQAGVPLALVGGPLPRVHWDLLDAIESAGGRVVLNATEAGERSLWLTDRLAASPPASPETEVTALDVLASDYLEHCTEVFQRPNTRLYAWLRERLAARKVRGIVVWHFSACDLWRAETQSLREAFGIPVLALEADDSPVPLRATGRLEAFLESLR